MDLILRFSYFVFRRVAALHRWRTAHTRRSIHLFSLQRPLGLIVYCEYPMNNEERNANEKLCYP